jgi:glycosyltransferase involved in cell wall biosynthesis
MKNILAVRTYYPHWGRHTGPHQVLKYLDPQRFSVKEKRVAMGSPLRSLTFLKNVFRSKVADNPYSVYGPNDLIAEISIFSYCMFKDIKIIHLFDAEHSLLFLPRWIGKIRHLRTFPKIVAMFHQPPSLLEYSINPAVVGLIDCILVVSPEQREYFHRILPKKRVELILLGVETDYFKPHPSDYRSGKLKCLAGGIWFRDYKALIKTARILKRYPEFEFHIVNPSLSISSDAGNIVVHSNISDKQFLELYQTSDILFMPLEASTANNVLLEGISCGLPVISTDLRSVRSYLQGQEAILIPDNDPRAFAEALLFLKNDREALSRMSQLARKRALELSWENLAIEYEQLYLSL